MREHAHTFGPDNNLVGIVTEPAIGERRSGAPALLLANVGMHHRVGPYRLFVDLARHMASLGFTTLRFDLSGLGDSARPADGGGSDDTRWALDMKSAMALLEQRHGVDRFVVLGLCSGVDPAHAIALSDPRIAGAIFVDGHAFMTRMHYVHRYVMRATKLRPWELFLKRRLPQLFGVQKERVPTDAFDRPPMTRERFVNDLETLLERKMPLLYAFTGELNDVFSHPQQFHDMVRPLDTRGRVDVTIYPRADHTFSIPEDRRDFVDRIGRWVSESFPLAEPIIERARTSEIPPPMSGVRLSDEASEEKPRRATIRLVG
jgi:hypothetical protein